MNIHEKYLIIKDIWLASFLLGIILILLGIAFLEYWEIRPKIKHITKSIYHFLKPKKSNETESL